MLKKLSLGLLSLWTACAVGAVELNRADQLQLESVKGIGPVIAGRIIEERRNGAFMDWQDFMSRVKGVGPGKAAQFSREGLTVNDRNWPQPLSLAPQSSPPLAAEAPARR